MTVEESKEYKRLKRKLRANSNMQKEEKMHFATKTEKRKADEETKKSNDEDSGMEFGYGDVYRKTAPTTSPVVPDPPGKACCVVS